MENKIREEFEVWAAETDYAVFYRYPSGQYEDVDTHNAWIAYQAGRNHPIEVSLEEAAFKLYQHTSHGGTPQHWQHDKEHRPDYIKDHYTRAKAVLSLVPNCVIKE